MAAAKNDRGEEGIGLVTGRQTGQQATRNAGTRAKDSIALMDNRMHQQRAILPTTTINNVRLSGSGFSLHVSKKYSHSVPAILFPTTLWVKN